MYLKCNVFLLADVFEKFRNKSLKNSGLRPTHYLSAPALSWDGMLSMTEFDLDLISDVDTYLFFEKAWGAVFHIFLKDNAKQTTNI